MHLTCLDAIVLGACGLAWCVLEAGGSRPVEYYQDRAIEAQHLGFIETPRVRHPRQMELQDKKDPHLGTRVGSEKVPITHDQYSKPEFRALGANVELVSLNSSGVDPELSKKVQASSKILATAKADERPLMMGQKKKVLSIVKELTTFAQTEPARFLDIPDVLSFLIQVTHSSIFIDEVVELLAGLVEHVSSSQNLQSRDEELASKALTSIANIMDAEVETKTHRVRFADEIRFDTSKTLNILVRNRILKMGDRIKSVANAVLSNGHFSSDVCGRAKVVLRKWAVEHTREMLETLSRWFDFSGNSKNSVYASGDKAVLVALGQEIYSQPEILQDVPELGSGLARIANNSRAQVKTERNRGSHVFNYIIGVIAMEILVNTTAIFASKLDAVQWEYEFVDAAVQNISRMLASNHGLLRSVQPSAAKHITAGVVSIARSSALQPKTHERATNLLFLVGKLWGEYLASVGKQAVRHNMILPPRAQVRQVINGLEGISLLIDSNKTTALQVDNLVESAWFFSSSKTKLTSDHRDDAKGHVILNRVGDNLLHTLENLVDLEAAAFTQGSDKSLPWATRGNGLAIVALLASQKRSLMKRVDKLLRSSLKHAKQTGSFVVAFGHFKCPDGTVPITDPEVCGNMRDTIPKSVLNWTEGYQREQVLSARPGPIGCFASGSHQAGLDVHLQLGGARRKVNSTWCTVDNFDKMQSDASGSHIPICYSEAADLLRVVRQVFKMLPSLMSTELIPMLTAIADFEKARDACIKKSNTLDSAIDTLIALDPNVMSDSFVQVLRWAVKDRDTRVRAKAAEYLGVRGDRLFTQTAQDRSMTIKNSGEVDTLVKCENGVIQVPPGIMVLPIHDNQSSNLSELSQQDQFLLVEAFRCPNVHACAEWRHWQSLNESAQTMCLPHYDQKAPGCSNCAKGFGRAPFDAFICRTCGNLMLQKITFVLLPTVMFALGMNSASKRSCKRSVSLLKIVQSFAVGAYIVVNALSGTRTFQDFEADAKKALRMAVSVAGATSSVYTDSFDCLVPGREATRKVWLMLSLAMPSALLFLTVFVMAVLLKSRFGFIVGVVRPTLVVTNTFLPQVIGAFMRSCACVHMQSHQPSFAAYSTEDKETCGSSFEHILHFVGILSVGMAVGPGFWISLIRSGKKMDPDLYVDLTGFLVGRYKPGKEYWECMVLSRKIALAVIAGVAPLSYAPAFHMSTASFIMITSLALHLHYKPFADDFLNWVESFALASVSAAITLASFVANSETQWGTSEEWTYYTLILSMTLIMIAAVALVAIYILALLVPSHQAGFVERLAQRRQTVI